MATTQTTRESAKQLARSAEKLEVSGERLESGDVRRTRLAGDRTLLAAERTYAAWVRTGLIALASGVGAHTALAGFLPKWLILLDSGLLILFSAFCFVAGVWRQFVPGVPPPEPDVPQLSPLGSARRERFAGVCVARGTGRAVAKSGMRHKSDMRHMPLRRHISVMSVVRLAR